MKHHRGIDLKTIQITAGIVILVIAGFVVQWWLLTGLVLFCLGLLFLCIVTIEQEVADQGGHKHV